MPGLRHSRACDVPIPCHNDKYWLLFSVKRGETFDVLLTVRLSVILVINQFNAQNLVL